MSVLPGTPARPLPAPLEALRGGLVISCQARPGTPLDDAATIARIAESAQVGGARGLRINSPAHVAAVRARTRLPIIGLDKVRWRHRSLITTSYAAAAALVDAGADILAIEVTAESPVDGVALIAEVRERLGVPVMADVATVEDALGAHRAGADVAGSTLSGYLAGDARATDPDLDLVARLVAAGLPTIAEGRYRTPGQIRSALALGAVAVVVGSAATDPTAITRSLLGEGRST